MRLGVYRCIINETMLIASWFGVHRMQKPKECMQSSSSLEAAPMVKQKEEKNKNRKAEHSPLECQH